MTNITEKVNYYNETRNNITDYQPDQTIITKRSLLKLIYGKEFNEPSQKEHELPEEWYPLANSYYAHTEDVDTLEKANFLLAEEPQFPAHFKLPPGKVSDEYNEKLAQDKYLATNPVCFLILGKPSIGQRDISKKLAEYWGCVLIEPQTVIEEEIHCGSSEIGKCIEFNLRSGRSIDIDIILRLVEKRVNSETAKHSGFVLSGLPLIPNDLYTEDKLSSPSAVFNANAVFEELIDAVVEIGISPNELSSSGMSQDDFQEMFQKLFLSKRQQAPKDLGESSYFYNRDRIGQDYEAQLNFMFGLLKLPYVIIYITCETKDALEKREKYRYDIKTKQFLDMQFVNHYQKMLYYYFRMTDNAMDDIFESEYLILDLSQFRQLVLMPHNFKANAAAQLKRFADTSLNYIEKQVLLHDPQYYIKLDARLNPARNLRIIRTRLKTLPLQRIIVPKKVSLSTTLHFPDKDNLDLALLQPIYGEDYEDTFKKSSSNKLEDYFKELRSFEVIHPNFQWCESDFGLKCPVAMSNGDIKEGDPQFMVQFMNKLYFLSDLNAYIKFCRNPRPYLLDNPKTPCQIFIFGPSRSGKTALAKCLGYYFDALVLSPQKIIDAFYEKKCNEIREKARIEACSNGIKYLNDQRKIDAAGSEKLRQEAIEKWTNTVTELIYQLIEALEYTNRLHKCTNSQMCMCDIERLIYDCDTEYSFPNISVVKQLLKSYNINDESCDATVWQDYLSNPDELLQKYLPDELRNEVKPVPANEDDEFVRDYVAKALSSKNLIKLTKNQIDRIEAFKYALAIDQRWVVDGMLPDVNLFEALFSETHGQEVVYLDDYEDASYLIRKLRKRDCPFPNYKEYFNSIHCPHIAERSTSATSTKSYRECVVKEILTDILDSDQFYHASEPDMESDMSDLDRKSTAYYESIIKYRDEFKTIRNFYKTTKPQNHMIEVIGANKTYNELFTDVLNKLLNRYRTQAYRLSYEEIKEEMVLDEDARWYGDTNEYCPVTFRDCFVLWKGKEDYAARFENKIYLMASEQDVRKFIKDPRQYLTKDYFTRKFPPPRICIIGFPKTGKTTIAKALAKNIGAAYVNYEYLVKYWFDINGCDTFETIKVSQSYHNHILQAYLVSGKALPDYLLQNLFEYWHKDPYRSVGFVFDDFPKRACDVEFLVKNRLIPDIVIHLFAPSTTLKSALLENALSTWKVKISKRRDWEQRNSLQISEREELRKRRFHELMDERREARYFNKIQEKLKSPICDVKNSELSNPTPPNISATISQVSFDSVAEQEDIDEITKIVDKDLPTLKFDYDLGDSIDVVRQKLERIIEESLYCESELIRDIRDDCQIENIPFTEIPFDIEAPEKTQTHSFKCADEFKFKSQSLFERCYEVSVELAEKLLFTGYIFLSKFGKTCPVQYYENENSVQMYLTMLQKRNIFPVIHRTYVYFIIGRENRQKFKNDPLKYVNVTFQFPLLPITVSIIGPPKCGKTTLAKRLKDEFGFKHVTRGMAARYVLNYLPYSQLANDLESVLRRGEEASEEMIIQCVAAAMYEMRIVTQGVIFDGFPNTVNEVGQLAFHGIVPNLAVDLTANNLQIYECLSNDTGRNNLPRFGKHVVDHLYNQWKVNADNFRANFDKEYQVTAQISIGTSNWSVFSQAKAILNSVHWEIKHYYNCAYNDWPLRLGNMRVTPLEFSERRSSFKSICPLCSNFTNKLVSGGRPPDRSGLVQYRHFYYWICEEHIELFMNCPDMYLPPFNKNSIPLNLPKIVEINYIPKNLFGRGICMVCYKQSTALVHGYPEFAIEYNEKIYFFDKEECLKTFFESPHDYLHHGFVMSDPGYPNLKYRELPVLGMLEQYVAGDVLKALNFVVKKRPVVPGLSVATSAAIGMAIFLKVNNKQLSKPYMKYYEQGFVKYNSRVDNLIKYLDRMKCTINPYLHYEEPFPVFAVPPSTTSGSEDSIHVTDEKIYEIFVDNK